MSSFEVAQANPLDVVYDRMEQLNEKMKIMYERLMIMQAENRHLETKITMLEHQIRMIESDCDARHSMPDYPTVVANMPQKKRFGLF